MLINVYSTFSIPRFGRKVNSSQYMDNEYYNNLPRKRLGAGALIIDSEERILLVKPSYKNYWHLPGGTVDDDESPRAACLRELKEEIGLEFSKAELIVVDYTYYQEEGFQREHLQFAFFCGKLSEAENAAIKIDGEENLEYKFVNLFEALEMVGQRVRSRLPHMFQAYQDGKTIYLENGEVA